jgi:hypothetical protein
MGNLGIPFILGPLGGGECFSLVGWELGNYVAAIRLFNFADGRFRQDLRPNEHRAASTGMLRRNRSLKYFSSGASLSLRSWTSFENGPSSMLNRLSEDGRNASNTTTPRMETGIDATVLGGMGEFIPNVEVTDS